MKIIAFCGIDGSGKTTQLQGLSCRLQAEGRRTITAKGVYYNFIHHTNEWLRPVDTRYAMAYQFVEYHTRIVREHPDIDYILCDRHMLCHLAYGFQHGANGPQDVDRLRHIMSIAPQPDLVLYFDMDVDGAIARIERRKDKPRYWDETSEIQTAASNAYRALLSAPAFKAEWINARDSEDAVARAVDATVLRVFGEL